MKPIIARLHEQIAQERRRAEDAEAEVKRLVDAGLETLHERDRERAKVQDLLGRRSEGRATRHLGM